MAQLNLLFSYPKLYNLIAIIIVSALGTLYSTATATAPLTWGVELAASLRREPQPLGSLFQSYLLL